MTIDVGGEGGESDKGTSMYTNQQFMEGSEADSQSMALRGADSATDASHSQMSGFTGGLAKPPNLRQVEFTEAYETALLHSLLYIETSAHEDINVDSLFKELVTEVHNK